VCVCVCVCGSVCCGLEVSERALLLVGLIYPGEFRECVSVCVCCCLCGSKKC
jgi:hypothetical protein